MKNIFTFLMLCLFYTTYAQDAIADLKFEEAEIAFNNKDYGTTIAKLNEFDKMYGSVTSKSLYLNIVSQYKLFEQFYNVSRIGASFNDKKGIIITEVFPNSPASSAGLLKNDIITKFNEIKISNADEFIELIKFSTANTVVKLQIVRNDNILEKNVTVEMNKELRDDNKIYYDDANFDKLVNLKKKINSYLNAMKTEEIDDKFREIYNIKTKLDLLPLSKNSWFEAKQKAEIESANRIIKAKELQEKDKALAAKIDSWEWNEKIKINANYQELKEDFPEFYKNLKKQISNENKVYYYNKKPNNNELMNVSLSASGKVESYMILKEFYKQTSDKNKELNKALEELKEVFGNDITFYEEIHNETYKRYFINCKSSLSKIGLSFIIYQDAINISIIKSMIE